MMKSIKTVDFREGIDAILEKYVGSVNDDRTIMCITEELKAHVMNKANEYRLNPKFIEFDVSFKGDQIFVSPKNELTKIACSSCTYWEFFKEQYELLDEELSRKDGQTKDNNLSHNEGRVEL